MFSLEDVALYNQMTLHYLTSNAILLLILVIASTPLLKVIYHKLIQSKYSLIIELIIIPVACLLILTLSTAYLVDSSYNPFLYFRF